MALSNAGEPGFYQDMLPCYTVFHKETETFSNLWTEYTSDYKMFCAAYEADLAEFGGREGMTGKPDVPENSFPVSMIPWTTFEGFNLNLQRGYTYLTPIFTMGRFYQENGKIWLPLAIQVHHAVCDGFHVCRFVHELQELIGGLFGSGSEAAAPGGPGFNEKTTYFLRRGETHSLFLTGIKAGRLSGGFPAFLRFPHRFRRELRLIDSIVQYPL